MSLASFENFMEFLLFLDKTAKLVTVVCQNRGFGSKSFLFAWKIQNEKLPVFLVSDLLEKTTLPF